MSRRLWISLAVVVLLAGGALAALPWLKAPEIELPPAEPLSVPRAELDLLPGFRPGPFAPLRSETITLAHADGRGFEARATYPDGNGPFPVILFSPGFGSDKDQYQAVIDHWVSHGYIVLASDHADSGGTVAAILASIRHGELGLIEARLQDMQKLWGSLGEFGDIDLLAIADTYNIVAAGHSFGALTAQMLAGARAEDEAGQRVTWSGPEVRAVVALSPPGEMFDVIRAESWREFRGPALMTTGTWDVDARFWTDWRAHLLSFENAVPGDQYALVIDGADHYLGRLIGRLEREQPPQDDALAVVRGVSATFLQGFVRGDPAARAWLDLDELEMASAGFAELRRR